jgi:hypothetical protein
MKKQTFLRINNDILKNEKSLTGGWIVYGTLGEEKGWSNSETIYLEKN